MNKNIKFEPEPGPGPDFDFYKDFEKKENIEKNTTNTTNTTNIPNTNDDELNMILNSFPAINNNLRTNILLSIEIYKKIKNFDVEYVHGVINDNIKK